MNVEIGAEAALFPEKEYISGISVAVYRKRNGPKAGLALHSLYSECGRAKMFCLVCCISPLFDTFSHSCQFRLNLNYAIL